MEEYLLRVEGHVQGVGFRAFARAEALGLDITGFVSNRHDGQVEVLAQGAQANIEAFIVRLQQGPRLAAVGNVAVFKRVLGKRYDSFEIR